MQTFPYPNILEQAGYFAALRDRFVEQCIRVQQVPAPTGDESERAALVRDEFHRIGLVDIESDEQKNVCARLAGVGNGPALLISAHTDTVFEKTTDLATRYDTALDRLFGPGIGDNSTGVAALILLAEIMAAQDAPPVDIWFVANSCEEGLGDLRGMRAVMDKLADRVGACIVIEGMGLGRIVHRALGSRRFRISVDAPGGHSWSDFGSPSALHVLAQIAADLTRLHVPEHPRTSFNIGRFQGGTSVNTIAQHAWLELDLRSEDMQALHDVIEQVMGVIHRYQVPRRQRRGVQVAVETIGDRPPGQIDESHPLVQAAIRGLEAAGWDGTPDLRISSTDANIPLSRNVPAVCVGITEGGGAHRLQEWIRTEPIAIGMRHLLHMAWSAATWLSAAGQAKPPDD
jgi:acetylornithine deacetylase/succinyl-diaminopimelate desuccinylase-like protein